jgi:hypothetical protein
VDLDALLEEVEQMTTDQVRQLQDFVTTCASFEGYEGARVRFVEQSDHRDNGDLRVGIENRRGDVFFRVKQDGTIYDVFKRRVTMNEALEQIRKGVKA